MELLKEIVPHPKRVAYSEGANPPIPPEVMKFRDESAAIVASKLGFT